MDRVVVVAEVPAPVSLSMMLCCNGEESMMGYGEGLLRRLLSGSRMLSWA